jgi:hypothetical protein
MAYGFMDINFNMESSSMVHEAGSSYFFIPQVNLYLFAYVLIQLCGACLFSSPCFHAYYHPLRL